MENNIKLEEIKEIIHKIGKKLCDKLQDEKLKNMFYDCFVNTIDTTVNIGDNDTFVITGDIPAMWLRDSTSQIEHYLPFVKEYPLLGEMFRGLINRHIHCIKIDSYANAFNIEDNGNKWDNDITKDSPWVWERKYEVDSMCYTVRMIYKYWKKSSDESFFNEDIRDVFKTIISQFKKEQRHFEESDYRFTRLNCPYQDTLHNNGLGNEVSYTGMTWSGFRPSDDACKYGYLVPSNMFAVVALRYIEEIAEKIYYDHKLAESAKKLSNEIEDGINKFAVVEHEKYGKIYAYEVDGRGNAILMDDANVPSLLSIPYIEYRTYDDEIYQNTRKFILSKDNPYYYEGKDAKGIGSAHTPENYIWHIALSIQGLTTECKQEKMELLKTLISTDGGKGLMHEGFNCDDSHEFTREWFAWSNSMFANFVYETLLEQ